MKKSKLILALVFLCFFSFASEGRAQSDKAKEAERWGFYRISEDFFSGRQEKAWGWEEDIEGVKRFISAVWGKITEFWGRAWGGLEIEDFSSTVKYDDIIDNLYRSGWSYYQNGDFDKAEKEWQKILAIDPQNERAKSAIRDIWRIR